MTLLKYFPAKNVLLSTKCLKCGKPIRNSDHCWSSKHFVLYYQNLPMTKKQSGKHRSHGPVCASLPPAGAVLYRVPLTWGQNKRPWKLLHGALMLLALVLAVLGLCAVFDFHNANVIPNLYSLHSWVGVATVALFAAQVAPHDQTLTQDALLYGLTVCVCVFPVGSGRGHLSPAL